MNNKFSNSSIDKYVECSLCYKLHYIDRIRPIRGKSALLFGGALDTALNDLLLNRNLTNALEVFHTIWGKVDPNTTDFSKSDLDQELLNYYKQQNSDKNPSWLSLAHKGHLFVTHYYKEVLPKIKKVLSIQEPVSLKNDDGDEITGLLDLIVKWEDGKTYLLDNKSSSVTYEEFSAKMGQQLPLYYYIVKEKYKLDGVGYIVLNKKINKNRVKKCKSCGALNNSSHKTCNEMIQFGGEVIDNSGKPEFIKGIGKSRCGGEFDVTINPSVDIQYVFNQVAESDEKRVLDKFDEVNYNVSNGYFATEHNPNKNKFFQYCPYKEYTPENPNFIKLPQREKK